VFVTRKGAVTVQCKWCRAIVDQYAFEASVSRYLGWIGRPSDDFEGATE
jgi:hypothetical protein